MRTRAVLALLAVCPSACGPPAVWRGRSPDHRTVFTVAASGERSCLKVDGVDRGCFDGLAIRHILFSPDSRRMAFPVKDGNEWRVVLDGVPGPPVAGVGDMVFSGDGGRLAYSAEREGAWRVVVDGRFGEPFDSLYAGTLTFDPTGRRVGFVAWDGGGAVPVIDGRREAPHQGVAYLGFSSDGEHVAYVARDASRVRLFVDGVPGPAHQAIGGYHIGSSPDGVAYLARDSAAWWLVRGGERWGPYPGVRALTGLGGGAGIGFVALVEGGEQVVVDGHPGPTFPEVDAPSSAVDGDAWGYVGRDTVQSSVIVRGRVVDAHGWAGHLVFSPDGERYAYVAANESEDVVIDDRGVTSFNMVVGETLQFLEDGERWACLAGDLKRRKLYVAVEGEEEVRPFEWSDLAEVAASSTRSDPIEELGVAALRAWVAVAAREIVTSKRPP